ncbi:hypothetical protein DI09_113p20 [Mitosporidium daphniae]|uniref:Uncharacterized protein n=1 Tax=Mitosporidium daphniae TaxID=1485682 RepID=A0A098VZ85_9MICR|nr:uncharacterized protein DI09_113p20 [Mitosporidium daphniae]KGG53061.1 hypothetical protein DI09_113p20 [Mitosporidium daphniae]|eukprot:XP_013239497.1 uncharacterized protein DI09_113p20 [Mitosporidium daphniae]
MSQKNYYKNSAILQEVLPNLGETYFRANRLEFEHVRSPKLSLQYLLEGNESAFYKQVNTEIDLYLGLSKPTKFVLERGIQKFRAKRRTFATRKRVLQGKIPKGFFDTQIARFYIKLRIPGRCCKSGDSAEKA